VVLASDAELCEMGRGDAFFVAKTVYNFLWVLSIIFCVFGRENERFCGIIIKAQGGVVNIGDV
jgi:hypothetical protein